MFRLFTVLSLFSFDSLVFAWFFNLNCMNSPQSPCFTQQRPQLQAPPYYVPPAPMYAVAPNSYVLPPSGYALPPAYVTPPPAYVTPPPAYVTPPPVYVTPPPPKCFLNDQGFKCCNRQLDALIRDQIAFTQERCNMQHLTNSVQNAAQGVFGRTFEGIVGGSGVTSKTYYTGELQCQRRTPSGKSVLMYGSAVSYTLGPNGSRPMTPEEEAERNYPASWQHMDPYDHAGL
ncbi:unnamed protein product [Caenorhabditis auriculariae]|uniref:Ground-like domain-containing protein n=1 Tax=Caenorhabditis auriculariae TaxID=2777116 RepID=A0A8S1H382_9PELO|nr:unnamed protein product [Caenorhabditis auriculariae]